MDLDDPIDKLLIVTSAPAIGGVLEDGFTVARSLFQSGIDPNGGENLVMEITFESLDGLIADVISHIVEGGEDPENTDRMKEDLVDVFEGLHDLFDTDQAQEVTGDGHDQMIGEGEGVHIQ